MSLTERDQQPVHDDVMNKSLKQEICFKKIWRDAECWLLNKHLFGQQAKIKSRSPWNECISRLARNKWGQAVKAQKRKVKYGKVKRSNDSDNFMHRILSSD